MVENEIISRKEAIALGLTQYFTGKPCAHGHVAKRQVGNKNCLKCTAFRAAQWTEKNKEHSRELSRARCRRYNERNREERNRRSRDRRLKNREENIQKCREWRAQNIEKVREYARQYGKENREKINEYSREMYSKEPKVKLRYFMQSAIRRALNGKDRKGKTKEILGYSGHDLKLHIESMFDREMSWENHGEWHIDHIVPVSHFLAIGVEDAKIINSLDNLRPIWALENLSKSCKLEDPDLALELISQKVSVNG